MLIFIANTGSKEKPQTTWALENIKEWARKRRLKHATNEAFAESQNVTDEPRSS